MQLPQALASSSYSSETNSPHCADSQANGESDGSPEQRRTCRVINTPLTDEGREEAIVLAGELVNKYMAKRAMHLLEYDITNSLLDKADADSSRLKAEEAARLMAELIKGRSAEVVARLEKERGLSA